MERTDEQIKTEVERLREIKPKVRRMSLFGDDNHKAIEVQIEVIENRLDEDSIYSSWEDNDHLRDAALEALAWLEGESEDESLVTGWESLAS